MMFIQRTNGQVSGIFVGSQHPGQEELPDDDAEVIAFQERFASPVARTPEQKLAAAGLTVSELKKLLGLA